MQEIVVEIPEAARFCQPGDEIRGRIRWECAELPLRIDLHLIYYTESKAPQHVEQVDSDVWEHPGARGERVFAFRLPKGPSGFVGRYFSLLWAVEAVINPSEVSASATFEMSPTGRNITLAVLDS